METRDGQALPFARTEQLVVQEVTNELLVYDLDRHKAHCLNKTSAIVWQHCDGKTTVSAVARLIEREMNMPVGDDVVWLALKQLEKFHLLQERIAQPRKVSRRDLILKYAPATLAVPLILSISSPTAAQASSAPPPPADPCIADPGGIGCPCTFDAQCNTFNCNEGMCGPEL
jgi:hypothetical protein